MSPLQRAGEGLVPVEPVASVPTVKPVRRLNPRKLLLSKWTAVEPRQKEKHFLVTRVIEPDPPQGRIELIELQAVHSGRSTTLAWRELTDPLRWHQGWR